MPSESQLTSRAESEIPAGPRRKRPRTVLACEGCKRRKSRCDVVSGRRCHRCEQLGVDCSFETDGTGQSWWFYELRRPCDRAELMLRIDLSALMNGGIENDRSQEADPFRAQLSGIAQQPNTQSAGALVDPYAEIQALKDRLLLLESQSSPATSQRVQTEVSADPLPGGITSLGQGAETSLANHVSKNTPSQQETPAARHGRDETWYRAFSAPEDFSLIHGGLRSMAEVGLRDPVAEGIIPAAHAEMAYQMFKHHISGILPYRPLLMTRSRLPTHPFLRSACLVYASRCVPQDSLFTPRQNRELEANVGQNILAYQFGCRASLESVLASLILSFLPYGQLPGATIASDIDAARMAGLAWGQLREFGSTIFFERMVDLLESDTPTVHISETLDNARLHFCVLTRVCWTNLSRCPSNDLPTALSDMHRRFLELLRLRGVYTELDRHLSFEHRALDVCMTQAMALRRLERVLAPTPADLRKGNEGTRAAMRQMDELRFQAASENAENQSLPSLLCQLSYLKWWIGIRNIWFGYRIATPLIVSEIYHEWLDSMTLAGQASADMIILCLKEEWDLKGLPKAIGNAVVLCFYTLSMGIAHLAHHYPTRILPHWLQVSQNLQAIQAVLSESCPAFQYMLRKAQTTLEEHQRQLQLETQPPPVISIDGVGTIPDANPAFSFNFGYDTGNNGIRVDGVGSGYNSRAEPSNLVHWDPFMELGHGWDWQQSTVFPDSFWNNRM